MSAITWTRHRSINVDPRDELGYGAHIAGMPNHFAQVSRDIDAGKWIAEVWETFVDSIDGVEYARPSIVRTECESKDGAFMIVELTVSALLMENLIK